MFRSGQRFYQEMSKNDPESPTVDPEQYCIDLRKNISIPKITEVGC